MRDISAGGLAKLATLKGTEPIIVVEVDWTDNSPTAYADRDVGTSVRGKILQVGELDAVNDVSGSSSSQELSVVLDDTSGEIKGILDTNDPHQRPARVAFVLR